MYMCTYWIKFIFHWFICHQYVLLHAKIFEFKTCEFLTIRVFAVIVWPVQTYLWNSYGLIILTLSNLPGHFLYAMYYSNCWWKVNGFILCRSFLCGDNLHPAWMNGRSPKNSGRDDGVKGDLKIKSWILNMQWCFGAWLLLITSINY